MYPEGERIVVIDDDEQRRQLIERILIDEGFAVAAVSEGFSAIRAAASGRRNAAYARTPTPTTSRTNAVAAIARCGVRSVTVVSA